jgi:hypothetical protein
VGNPDFQDLIDRLAAASTEARQVIREAHAATKDLRREVKEAERLVATIVQTQWDEKLDPVLKESIAMLRDGIAKAQAAKADQIIAAFDRLSNTILYGSTNPAKGAFLFPDDHPMHRAAKEAEAAMKTPVDVDRG